MRPRLTRCVAAIALAIVAAAGPSIVLGQALPFLAPGDSRLRSMVQLEADGGKIPLSTTWPLPTLDVPAEERDALRGYNQPGSATDAGWFVSAADNPTKLRSFSDTPRENGEAGLQSGWAAEDYAGGAIRMSYAFDPEDGMHYRFDGTYAAYRLGNWWLTAGEQDRWWGPGWDSSLIYSSNARPMPGLGIERASSTPFRTKWLSWLGPWRFVALLDHMENHRADFNNTLFWAGRFTFQPAHGLEIGISRTAQFCGQGRPCGISTFLDMLIAKSNRKVNAQGSGQAQEELLKKKSAQRIATDVRWHIGRSPFSVYWQQYGEVFDSGNYRPRQTLQLFGAELASWGYMEGRFRAFLEFADTACGAVSTSSSDKPNFGCAYEKDTWQAGYRYRDRSIGDSMDRDGRRFTFGTVYSDTGGRAWEVRVRHFDLNRGGIAQAGLVPHTVSTVAEELWNSEVKIDGAIGALRYSFGAGADYGSPVGEPKKWIGRMFIELSRPW